MGQQHSYNCWLISNLTCPSATINPRMGTEVVWNSHFSAFTKRQFSKSCCRTWQTCWMCLLMFLEKIRMSSKYTNTKRCNMSRRTSFTVAWKSQILTRWYTLQKWWIWWIPWPPEESQKLSASKVEDIYSLLLCHSGQGSQYKVRVFHLSSPQKRNQTLEVKKMGRGFQLYLYISILICSYISIASLSGLERWELNGLSLPKEWHAHHNTGSSCLWCTVEVPVVYGGSVIGAWFRERCSSSGFVIFTLTKMSYWDSRWSGRRAQLPLFSTKIGIEGVNRWLLLLHISSPGIASAGGGWESAGLDDCVNWFLKAATLVERSLRLSITSCSAWLRWPKRTPWWKRPDGLSQGLLRPAWPHHTFRFGRGSQGADSGLDLETKVDRVNVELVRGECRRGIQLSQTRQMRAQRKQCFHTPQGNLRGGNLMEQRLPHAAETALALTLTSLSMDITPLSSEEYGIIAECLRVLAPFNAATVELSKQKRVSGPKVIPLRPMLNHSQQEEVRIATTPLCTSMTDHLRRQFRDRLQTLKSMSIMSLATLLGPRFKNIGFLAPQKQQRHWGGSWLNALLSCETACHCPPHHYHLHHHLHHNHPHQKLLSLWPKVIYTVHVFCPEDKTADATVEVQ